MLDFLSLELAPFLRNFEMGVALNVNGIWNGLCEMLELALCSVNCLNHFCCPLSESVIYLFCIVTAWIEIPYLPLYKSILCISRPPILEPKNKFFLFLCKNFLEKLIFHQRISFLACYGYTKKITASLDVKFTIAHTWAFRHVLVTQV